MSGTGMTPDELRKLADEATPGPWVWEAEPEALVAIAPGRPTIIEGGGCEGLVIEREADARLIALAPDLARRCAELGEALARIQRGIAAEESDEVIGYMRGEARSALAKLAGLKT